MADWLPFLLDRVGQRWKRCGMTALSLLDFAHVTQGATLAQAFHNTVAAARHAHG